MIGTKSVAASDWKTMGRNKIRLEVEFSNSDHLNEEYSRCTYTEIRAFGLEVPEVTRSITDVLSSSPTLNSGAVRK